MSKLGYTWYQKDWNTSEAVFQLDLSERGLYRELIDLAFLNDNKTKINSRVWTRKFNTSKEELESILDVLQQLELIEVKDNVIFIPSCEPRLNMIRGGRNGGLKSRKNKPTEKPINKPTSNQKKVNKKETKYYRKFDHLKITQEEVDKLRKEFTIAQIDNVLDSIENYAKNKSYKNLYLTAKKWLTRQFPKVEVKEEEILTAFQQQEQRRKLQKEQAQKGL